MANNNRPFGARLVGHIYGSSISLRIREYVATDANALFLGDFIKPTGTAVTLQDRQVTLPECTVAAAGDVLGGVVVAVGYNPTNLYSIYRPASVTQTIFVCDDPNAMFEIQSAGLAALTDVGANADIVYGAGSTITGVSATTISTTTASGTAQLRILGFSQRPDNEIGNYSVFDVMINEHYFKQATGI